MGASEAIEIMLRGLNAGADVLLAVVLLGVKRFEIRRALGALFAVGSACYALVSSTAIYQALGPAMPPVQALSIAAPVFFWWFVLSLFDDEFQFTPILFVPLLAVSPLIAANFLFTQSNAFVEVALALQRACMAFVYGHAIFTAMRRFNDDLIEGRRRFRIVLSIAVAVTGLLITWSEASGVAPAASIELKLLHATALILLTLGFGLWLLSARTGVMDRPARAQGPVQNGPSLNAADRVACDTLAALMDGGIWREEGLTVAGLSSKVGLPEHQLRRLINGELGFRNFSAFLNERRIAAAKAALSDPAQARRQVLQIALDVGFGSIAPFNRAFKDATGKTPTEFRKAALVEA